MNSVLQGSFVDHLILRLRIDRKKQAMVGTTPVYSQTGSYSKSPAAHFLTQRVWRDVGERAENFDLDEADEEEDEVEDGEEALLGSGSDLDDTRAERAGAGTHGAGRRYAKREREVSLSSVSTKSGQHGLVPSGSGTSPRPLENASQPASARPRRRRRHSSTHSGSLGTSLTRSGVDHSKPHRSLSPNELPQIVLHKDRHDEERPLLLHGEELVDALEEITEQMPDDVKQARDHGASVRNELSSLLRYTAPIGELRGEGDEQCADIVYDHSCQFLPSILFANCLCLFSRSSRHARACRGIARLHDRCGVVLRRRAGRDDIARYALFAGVHLGQTSFSWCASSAHASSQPFAFTTDGSRLLPITRNFHTAATRAFYSGICIAVSSGARLWYPGLYGL